MFGSKKPKTIHQLKAGKKATIEGTVVKGEEVLTSPISGVACVWFRIKIQIAELGETTYVMVDERMMKDFIVEDETGKVAVKAKNLEVKSMKVDLLQQHIPTEVRGKCHQLLKENNFFDEHLEKDLDHCHYIEERLAVGSKVSITGDVVKHYGPETLRIESDLIKPVKIKVL